MPKTSARAQAETPSIAILISPRSDEFFHAYGPMTRDRDAALKFPSRIIAERAALSRFGRLAQGFWGSERVADKRAAEEFRDWTYRIEPSVPAVLAR